VSPVYARTSRTFALATVCAPALLLAGCSTFGTNIKGSFSCGAPGGSCAPSSVIDDQAIASIQQRKENESAASAGPYELDDGDGPKTHVASDDGPRRRGQSLPHANGRVLRVVFPAYVDRLGQLHEKSAVQAEVDVPQLQLADAGPGERTIEGPDAGLFGAAESAPELLALSAASSAQAPTALAAAPKIAGATSGSAKSGASKPSTTVKVAPAAAPSPIDTIKQQVAEQLAHHAKVQAAAFPAKVD
jgi:conjugal transfer pilus assembly protein TraV